MCSTEAHYGYQYFWYGLVFITLVNCQVISDKPVKTFNKKCACQVVLDSGEPEAPCASPLNRTEVTK